MATFQNFEEIEAWQKARELTRRVYSITNSGAFARDFALRDQIRRASISISSNIAEGFERDGTSEFSQFLSIAKGSTGEVRTQLYLAFDQGYIDERTFHELLNLTTETGRKIGGLMKYLRQTAFRGGKFKH
jgi:four helix bundle protein